MPDKPFYSSSLLARILAGSLVLALLAVFIAAPYGPESSAHEREAKAKRHNKKTGKKKGKKEKAERGHSKDRREHDDDRDHKKEKKHGKKKHRKKRKKKCGPSGPPPADPLAVVDELEYPTRLARGADGTLYVSDARLGAVFLFDTNLKIVGELKSLDLPLGVAVDGDGKIYVGNDGRDNIEVYSSTGTKLLTMGPVLMPNDLDLDRDGLLYVADSKSDVVVVYDALGKQVRTIGAAAGTYAGLRFPAAVAVAYRADPLVAGGELAELYVANQESSEIHVFDLQGRFLRALGGSTQAFSSSWKGSFTRVQGLAVDSSGRLHVLDCYLNRVQILDADTGDYLNAYAAFGADAERLKVPLDLVLTPNNQAIVTNAELGALEVFTSLP